MGYAIGEDTTRDRFIGYGVPATCDQPECGESINRGMSYRCGIYPHGGCGLYFCGNHLYLSAEKGRDEDGEHEFLCDRCQEGLPPYEPTPDTPEWANHVMTDDSWQQWRDQNPESAAKLRSIHQPTAKD